MPDSDVVDIAGSLRAHEAQRASLERYERLEQLGAGGMAVVWRARDRKLGREVALKELRPELEVKPEGLARFRREAEVIARLSHANVVSFFDIVEDQGRTFLVLELVRGAPLSRLLAERKLDLRARVALLEKVARGVQHAHEQGVVHRDLKPQNVLVAENGEPKVGDFGVAHLAQGDGTTLTKSGALIGTPTYMPPEQADGRAIDRRVDVYALGAILYEMLVGRPPFVADSIQRLLKKVLFDEPSRPRAIDPRVHVDLETIALKCLAKEPERRYAEAKDVADELGRFLDGESILARPPTRLERARLWTRRNRKLAVGAALLAVAVAGAGALGLARLEERWHRAGVIEAELARAASTDSDLDPAAVDRIVAVADDAAVARLSAELDAIAVGLRAATRDVLLAAKEPQPDEARSGARTLDGLEGALDRWFAGGDDDLVDEAAIALVRTAERRLEDRAARERPFYSGAPDPKARLMIAAEQEKRLTPARRRVAMLATDALGHIGRREAVPALARFLAVAQNELTATSAGVALARIGGREAERHVFAARRRFHSTGVFWIRVQPVLASSGVKVEEIPADDEVELRERGINKALRGDKDGAIADLTSAIALDAHDALAWYNRGCARLDKSELDGAMTDFVKALELKPDDAGFWNMLGIAKKNRGDLRGAIAACTSALALDPKIVNAYITRGNARRAAGDARGAIADISSAIALDPSNVGAWVNRGIAHRETGDTAGAVADYTQALAIDPESVPALLNRGEAYRRSKRFEKALADLSRALELEPRAIDGRVNRGLCYLGMGDPDAAIAEFDRAIEQKPTFAMAWWQRGIAWKDKGDLKRSLADLDHAVELSPRSMPLLGDRGAIRRISGDLDGAIEDLEAALALDSRSKNAAIAFANLGGTRLNKGDIDGAIRDLTRALAIVPRYADALVNRGEAKCKKGDLEGAEEDLTDAIDIAPRDKLAWGLRAQVRARRGDRRGAADDLGRMIELTPRNAIAWSQRGALRLLLGETDGALADTTRAIEIDPRLAQAFENRGAVRHKRGELKLAIEDFTRAIELDAKAAQAYYGRGLVHAQRDEKKSAIEDLSRALELGLDTGPAEDARARLKELEAPR